MFKVAALLAALLYVSAPTPSYAQSQGAGVPGQARESRKAISYTGFEINVSVTASVGGAASVSFPSVRVVHAGSPAQQAGMVAGDVITEVNGRDTREPGTLRMEPGIRYTLRIRRGEEELEVVLTPLPPRDAPVRPGT